MFEQTFKNIEDILYKDAGADSELDLRDTDIGRPFTDLVNQLKYPELEKHAPQVLKSLAPIETSIVTTKAQWFSIRIVPYRTIDDRINGLVITFTDITELEKLSVGLAKVKE